MEPIYDLNNKQTTIEIKNEEQSTSIQQQENEKIEKEARVNELRKMFAEHNVSYDKHVEKIEYYSEFLKDKNKYYVYNPFQSLLKHLLNNVDSFEEYKDYLFKKGNEYFLSIRPAKRREYKALNDLLRDIWYCPLCQVSSQE